MSIVPVPAFQIDLIDRPPVGNAGDVEKVVPSSWPHKRSFADGINTELAPAESRSCDTSSIDPLRRVRRALLHARVLCRSNIGQHTEPAFFGQRARPRPANTSAPPEISATFPSHHAHHMSCFLSICCRQDRNCQSPANIMLRIISFAAFLDPILSMRLANC